MNDEHGVSQAGEEYLDEGASENPEASSDDRTAVLEVFGLKLEVANPMLAELLTMNAREALTSDIKDLKPARPTSAEIREAVPDAVLAASTPRSDVEERQRAEFRARAETVGASLGFDIEGGSVWSSSAGLDLIVRYVDKPVTLAAASHFVAEIAAHRDSVAGSDGTALFVVESQQSADVFKVAIRERHLYDLIRTISLDKLEAVGELRRQGILDHAGALILLMPIANIDVGEVLSVISAAVHAGEHHESS